MTGDIRTATVRALSAATASVYGDVMAPALRETHLAVSALAGDVTGLPPVWLTPEISAAFAAERPHATFTTSTP